ncbi:acetyl-CoA C-acetyltransferase [Pullulanibacillus sp. KACC 23026]|uniref:thiolase family protein n=1 Tax=Pullulanibacillus sp. KACC 23026 TaxID=3028315 RepID=UPI0023B1E984|nr:acetyl-CoA C-acetyltransferase [Pullulanibacillus sp. KACC 23026]WEG11467.1 acetyl-CoA C-acetyltransferase [Pullulanibacillus sp. KACC 23026]
MSIYLLEGARTPFGSMGKSLRNESAVTLGVAASKAALERAAVEAEAIDQVVFGNVIHSDRNAAYLARHIGLKSGVPEIASALTVNRLCGSGLQAVVSAAQGILLNESEAALVGGAENMSQSPYSNFTIRGNGAKFGSVVYEDMLLSTLTDDHAGCGMGITAENLAKDYAISREEQDEYAALSHERAAKARSNGRFREEIVAVPTKKGLVEQDEHIREGTSVHTLSGLKPSFLKEGTVTAGNASGINDGAAALVISNNEFIEKRNLKPLAKIVSWGMAGVDPTKMGIGPVPSSQMALKRAGLSIKDIDLVEINEAFSAQYLAVEKALELDREKTNVNGGAIALGHPVGASGARLLLTLAYELRNRGKRYGLASLCIGGGQGIAMVIENQAF